MECRFAPYDKDCPEPEIPVGTPDASSGHHTMDKYGPEREIPVGTRPDPSSVYGWGHLGHHLAPCLATQPSFPNVRCLLTSRNNNLVDNTICILLNVQPSCSDAFASTHIMNIPALSAVTRFKNCYNPFIQ